MCLGVSRRMCLSGSERVDECVSVGVRESTRVDECVSVGVRESTNVCQWE